MTAIIALMKWLAATSLLFFAFTAQAVNSPSLGPQTAQHPATKVDVINGRHFYSLQNARRFNGSTNSPKALSVLHHPREQAPAVTRKNAYLPGPPASQTNVDATGTPMPKNASDQVLSVFAPEDKRLAPAPATK